MSRNVKWRMQQAAQLLLAGNSSKAVAEQLGARAETISRWKKHPLFINEYERLAGEMRDEIRVKLLRFSLEAVEMMTVHLDEGDYDEHRFKKSLDFLKAIKIDQILTTNNVDFTPKPAAKAPKNTANISNIP